MHFKCIQLKNGDNQNSRCQASAFKIRVFVSIFRKMSSNGPPVETVAARKRLYRRSASRRSTSQYLWTVL